MDPPTPMNSLAVPIPSSLSDIDSEPSFPRTITCACCERILTDTTYLSAGSAKTGTVTFTHAIVRTKTTLITSSTGWDKYSNYYHVYCPKCGSRLGQRYLAGASPEVINLLEAYTLDVDKICMYTPHSWEPAAPIVERKEVLRQLHPEPDEWVPQLAKVMGVCVGLMENLRETARVTRDAATAMGVEAGETVERLAGNGAPHAINKLEALRTEFSEKIKRLDALESLEKQIAELKKAITSTRHMPPPAQQQQKHKKRKLIPEEEEEEEGEEEEADNLEECITTTSPPAPIPSNTVIPNSQSTTSGQLSPNGIVRVGLDPNTNSNSFYRPEPEPESEPRLRKKQSTQSQWGSVGKKSRKAIAGEAEEPESRKVVDQIVIGTRNTRDPIESGERGERDREKGREKEREKEREKGSCPPPPPPPPRRARTSVGDDQLPAPTRRTRTSLGKSGKK